ncbi:hypothetical protein F3059_04135 [Salibacter halophilus]|uniref:Magnesium citrate secondary transporter n=2 Tax=Salibacter halophilus TaxID=1803916 RepID=A0A6N6MCN0_9FLAO|nr:hypothetical protein F3059_04135 [Salibacter halophilus]
MLVPYSVFAMNQLGWFDGLNSSLINSYLNDLLALPIILHLALIPMKYIVFKDENHALGIFNIIITFLAVSLVFEWWLPNESDQYIADYFDVLCYAIGSIWFYFAIDKRQAKPSTNRTYRRLENI